MARQDKGREATTAQKARARAMSLTFFDLTEKKVVDDFRFNRKNAFDC